MKLKLLAISFAFSALLFSCNEKGKEDGTISTTLPPEDETPTLFIRKNANSPEAKADLEAMAVALQKMRVIHIVHLCSYLLHGILNGIACRCEKRVRPWV